MNKQLLDNAYIAKCQARDYYNNSQGESEASTARLWARVQETEAEYNSLLQQFARTID